MDEKQFVPVCKIDEIAVDDRLLFEIDEQPIVIFNVNGELFAIGEKCSHRHGPLGEGELDGFVVTCPWHGARFDIRTGKALSLPAVKNVDSYPVRISDGMIEIGI